MAKIYFLETGNNIEVRNKQSGFILGYIKYFKGDSEYIFSQSRRNVCFTAGDLRDISKYMEEKNKK